MCLALAAYENRIASLLETANRFIVVDLPPVDLQSKKVVAIVDNTLPCLIQLLRKDNITILICGAINGCMYRAIENVGIHVVPWITGNIDDVIAAFINNTMEQWVMPGCMRGHRRGSRGRHGWNKMNLN